MRTGQLDGIETVGDQLVNWRREKIPREFLFFFFFFSIVIGTGVYPTIGIRRRQAVSLILTLIVTRAMNHVGDYLYLLLQFLVPANSVVSSKISRWIVNTGKNVVRYIRLCAFRLHGAAYFPLRRTPEGNNINTGQPSRKGWALRLFRRQGERTYQPKGLVYQHAETQSP